MSKVCLLGTNDVQENGERLPIFESELSRAVEHGDSFLVYLSGHQENVTVKTKPLTYLFYDNRKFLRYEHAAEGLCKVAPNQDPVVMFARCEQMFVDQGPYLGGQIKESEVSQSIPQRPVVSTHHFD